MFEAVSRAGGRAAGVCPLSHGREKRSAQTEIVESHSSIGQLVCWQAQQGDGAAGTKADRHQRPASCGRAGRKNQRPAHRSDGGHLGGLDVEQQIDAAVGQNVGGLRSHLRRANPEAVHERPQRRVRNQLLVGHAASLARPPHVAPACVACVRSPVLREGGIGLPAVRPQLGEGQLSAPSRLCGSLPAAYRCRVVQSSDLVPPKLEVS